MKIEELYDIFLETRAVSTDTRQIKPGSMFFALRGEKFNANEFAEQALSKGASYCVLDDGRFAVNEKCIVVENVLSTLQGLARYHRQRLNIPVIGLTGSNGKTTSKELLNAVLSTKFKTYATRGNLNNHIGVPLTLLEIDESIEIAVVEMGANHLGEIALLSSIAQPTHGFITNIGKAHIGTFGGYENIIRGKSELYQHLLTNKGVVFINSKSEVLAKMAKRFAEPVFYPSQGDYYHCELLGGDPYVILKAENDEEIKTSLIGTYNFENIAAALCIGKYFGTDPTLSNAAIASYVPGNMRSQLLKKNSSTIILDAYNANPSSMKAAIENLSTIQAQRKVVIIGDMYELEDEAEKEHQEIGKLLQNLCFNEVYLCGPLMKAAQIYIPSAKHFHTREELTNALRENTFADATILVKASRGMGLESVVDFL